MSFLSSLTSLVEFLESSLRKLVEQLKQTKILYMLRFSCVAKDASSTVCQLQNSGSRHLMRTSTEFMSLIPARTISTSFGFRDLVKGRLCIVLSPTVVVQTTTWGRNMRDPGNEVGSLRAFSSRYPVTSTSMRHHA